MAFDQTLAERVRNAFPPDVPVEEKRMFGGLALLVRGHMCCGVLDDRLMIRIAPDHYEAALREPHVKVMDFTGRPMRGFVYVAPPGIASDADLRRWVSRGLDYVSMLPPKG
jgi:TfoX/Sxy family transcriptional regulator of competence genes